MLREDTVRKKGTYAARYLGLSRCESLAHLQTIFKVKAHRILADHSDPRTRFEIMGSDAADKAAESAIGLHLLSPTRLCGKQPWPSTALAR